VYDDYVRLQDDNLPVAKVYKHGTHPIIEQRLVQALHLLETLNF
jgi:hypothetical protein